MTQDLYPLLLLSALVLVAIPGIWKALCLMPTGSFSRLLQRRFLVWTMFVMAVSGCSLLAVDWIDFSQGSFSSGRQMASIFGSILSVVGVSGLFAADQWLSRSTSIQSGRWISRMLLLALLGTSSIIIIRFQHRIGYSSEYAIAVFPDGKITPEPMHLAKTDRGNLIELYRFEIAEDKWKEFAARSEERFKNFGAAMIRRDQANARSNCHGWVFAYGKFLLSGSDVETILAENGYEQVIQPRAGDVIVYRSQFGKVLHTGLVQSVLDDGSPLIESKWAVDQRYIHQAKDQPFSTIYEYYRTHRPTHHLAIFQRLEVQQSDKECLVKTDSESSTDQSF